MDLVKFGVLLLSFPTVLTFFFGDHCTVFPQGFIPDGEHREYVVPKSCQNGTIDWNYPKEFIIVHFRRETHLKYSVCLGDSIGGNMFTLFDITGNTRQPIPKDTWPCLDAQDGTVSIEIHAPEMQTYMGAVDYSVQI
ncbi:uncharacterized protein LOC111133272 [Crassostrea virginica]|uniref:Uncharacterized protein LOC111138037 n=1 Tax=Crassostrea virginica TaxID=6565 RepID=A0A8B8EZM9_CRAVI|nr:uncharacterized protein LOC111138037 [Crassostrea virginica]